MTYQHEIVLYHTSTSDVSNLVENQEEVKSNSTCLALYYGNKSFSSFGAFDHEYDSLVATKEVTYTLLHLRHQDNGLGQKGHVCRNHFHQHHK